ncbi:hypothetical protein JXB11_01875 [Candidatus Woesearchaeota archaeon]|nr:hypothetical protein [Candidatus Woesearchaeota archaeon]
MTHICSNCNYKFEPKGKVPNKCPYCDKEGTLSKSKSMQEWIDEVSDEMKEG